MHYRLIDGTIHAQRASGQDWVPLSKIEANDLLRRLYEDEPQPFEPKADNDQLEVPIRH